MTLRLLDLEAPLDDVELPNGTKHQPIPFGPKEYHLWREIPREPDAETRGHMLLAIVKACYPTLTEEAILECCTEKMLIAMAAHAGRKIDQIRDALKNGVVVGAETTAPLPAPAAAPSSPKMSGATSSRKSRARSGKTGSTPTTASLTASLTLPGTATTSSTTSSASTSLDGNSTTSTVRTSSPAP
jgi:hypothetical protein